MRDMTYPPKPRPGDRVAVVSPSPGLPAIFPEVYELGTARVDVVAKRITVRY